MGKSVGASLLAKDRRAVPKPSRTIFNSMTFRIQRLIDRIRPSAL